MRCLVLLLLCTLGTGLTHGHEDDSTTEHDIKLTADEANGFMTHSRARRGLHHECYNEGCTLEEVKENLGDSQRAYEYYYTYTCRKFRQNCKIECKYRKDCSFGNWGSWTPLRKLNSGCNNIQHRFKQYRHPIRTTLKRHNCNGFRTSCPLSPLESRKYCVCHKAVCRQGSWSSWTGSVTQGGCSTQTRRQYYIRTGWSTENRIGSCQGVSVTCPSPKVDFRKRCSCKEAICDTGNWGSWNGHIAEGKCGYLVSKYERVRRFIYREYDNCIGVFQHCQAQEYESKRHMKFCSCKTVRCRLGEWSEWSPKTLVKGLCGQQQTRRKQYKFAVEWERHAKICPSLPQKCSDDIMETRKQCSCAYRDSCDLGAWSQWSSNVTEEGCKIQDRTRPYTSPLKHAQGDNCNGLNTTCVDEPKESRTFCKCKYLQCNLGQWSDWSNDTISEGSCKEQRRTRSYTSKEVFADRVSNCDGLPTTCPSDQHETRSMCKCMTVRCEEGDWGPWQGDIPADSCSTQTRKKSISVTEQLKYQENTCKGLPIKCTEPKPESRKMCNCSHREDCTLKEWGSWSGDVPDVGCVVQLRHREYNNSIIHIEKESCDGFDACTAMRDETRQKCNCNQIICNWTEWFQVGYNKESRCKEEVRVQNVSSGFKKIQKLGSCDGIPTLCTNDNVEKRKDCQSGGGNVIITSPPVTTPATTVPPTTAFVPATYVSLGCFGDSEKNRSMSTLYLNIRHSVDWYDLKKTVQACANEAREKRFKYFGVQFYGECWGGPNAGKTFALHGPSKKCWNGIGEQWANAVYRIENMPACSDELQFSASVSSGNVAEGSWCAGDKEKYQWIVVDLKSTKRITGIGTQGGNKGSWVTVYNLEYSEEGNSWTPYKEGGVTKVFAGNSDRFTLETHWLKFPVSAQYLRFKPQSWTSTHICMKVRVYGCSTV